MDLDITPKQAAMIATYQAAKEQADRLLNAVLEAVVSGHDLPPGSRVVGLKGSQLVIDVPTTEGE